VVTFLSLSELLDTEFPAPKWAIDRLIPEGLTVLAGKPKLGKSWLCLDVALAVASGGYSLGTFRADRGAVLYLALEDSSRRMRDRMVKLGARDLDAEAAASFFIETDWPQMTRGGLDQLVTWLNEFKDARLIVVDTFQKFRGPGGGGRDRYAEDYEAAGQLHQVAKDAGVAILAVHHLRKEGADDWLDTISGTSGITGAADTVAALFRDRGQADATLRLTGRDISEVELALGFNGHQWKDLGDPDLYRPTQERGEILKAIATLGGEAKVAEVADTVGKRSATVSKLLTGLHNEGKVRNTRYGYYALTTPVEVDEVVEVLTASTTSTTPPTSTTSTTSTKREKEEERQ